MIHILALPERRTRPARPFGGRGVYLTPSVVDVSDGFRSPVAGRRDYSAANRRGDRGVVRYFTLHPGRTYEVWDTRERYSVTISEGGECRRLEST